MQVHLTGFFEHKTGEFMRALWSMLLSAQNSLSGIPRELLEMKKEEIRQRKVGPTLGASALWGWGTPTGHSSRWPTLIGHVV